MNIACIWFDFIQISTDLFSGKSLPIMLAIVMLPLFRPITIIIVAIGLLCGIGFSTWIVRATCGLNWRLVSQGNRLVQMIFSAGLSLSLALHLGTVLGGWEAGGLLLVLVPAFCLCAENLPQRHSSPLACLLLAIVAIPVGFAIPLEAGSAGLRHDVLGLGRQRQAQAGGNVEEQAQGVWDVVGRAMQLFVCAFYAGVQHAPIQVYHASKEEHQDASVEYCSPAMRGSARYAFLMLFLSGCLRLSVFFSVCVFQDNAMHVLLEGARGYEFNKACVCCLMVYLLYQACWTLTQLREQVMPSLDQVGLHTPRSKVKMLVVCLALASFPLAEHAQVVFWVTNVLAGCAVLAACLTLRK
jgi:hypothetical protein